MVLYSPVFFVAIGGATGATLRYFIQQYWQSPWATLSINVLGCMLIGMATILIQQRLTLSQAQIILPFIITGVLGGFTTFSAFAHEATSLFHRPVITAAYISGSVFGGLLAYQVGSWLATVLVK